ncbi:mambaquaretin-4-like [Episyrphus balteatus]|uniref:mambaquaretin-4-like n=1 Tax=Episyrphus balteatus TaxID=286459 RepID=UPI002485BB12|nr:mambaquaretin-4-like [Episyrphus balteatus]
MKFQVAFLVLVVMVISAFAHRKYQLNLQNCPKADKGPCKGHEIVWVYKDETNDCHTFIYGGCEGNWNRFKTKKQCIDACGH